MYAYIQLLILRGARVVEKLVWSVQLSSHEPTQLVRGGTAGRCVCVG